VAYFYRRCQSCRTPDVTAHWRTDHLAVLCVSCHLDGIRHAEAAALAPTPTREALTASVADLVTCPAARAALARNL